jgi:hypothetical protein
MAWGPGKGGNSSDGPDLEGDLNSKVEYMSAIIGVPVLTVPVLTVPVLTVPVLTGHRLAQCLIDRQWSARIDAVISGAGE